MNGDPDLEYALIDETIVKLHQKATGAKKRDSCLGNQTLARRSEDQDAELVDALSNLIRFVATTNHKSRIMGAVLSRFRVIDLDPPSNLDWVDRAKAILEAEGLTPARADVEQMLQSFQGSARDLVDLIEETVIASKALAS